MVKKEVNKENIEEEIKMRKKLTRKSGTKKLTRW